MKNIKAKEYLYNETQKDFKPLTSIKIYWWMSGSKELYFSYVEGIDYKSGKVDLAADVMEGSIRTHNKWGAIYYIDGPNEDKDRNKESWNRLISEYPDWFGNFVGVFKANDKDEFFDNSQINENCMLNNREEITVGDLKAKLLIPEPPVV